MSPQLLSLHQCRSPTNAHASVQRQISTPWNVQAPSKSFSWLRTMLASIASRSIQLLSRMLTYYDDYISPWILYLTKSAIAITIRWTRSCSWDALQGVALEAFIHFFVLLLFYYFFLFLFFLLLLLLLCHHNNDASHAFWWLAKTMCTCKTRSHIEVPGLIKAVGRVALHSTSFRGRRSPLVDVFDSTTACGTLPRNALFLI